MKTFAMVVGAALLVGAAACSSSSNGASSLASGNCPTVGATTNCSADAPATQTDVDNCNKLLNDPTCGAKYKAVIECAGQNDKCGSDNKTDENATFSACGSQISDYSSCSTPASDAGTDAGS